MTPKQFWESHPIEIEWLLEAKRPPKMYGQLTEQEAAELYEETYG